MSDHLSTPVKPRPVIPPPPTHIDPAKHPSTPSSAALEALTRLGDNVRQSPKHLSEEIDGDWVDLSPGRTDRTPSDDSRSDKEAKASSESKESDTSSSGGVMAYLNSLMPWSSPSKADLALAKELELQRAREEAEKLEAALERELELQRAREEADKITAEKVAASREIEEAIITLNASLEPILRSLEEHLASEQAIKETFTALLDKKVSHFLEGEDRDNWGEYQAFKTKYTAAKPNGHSWNADVSKGERKRLNQQLGEWEPIAKKLIEKSNQTKREQSQPIREELKEVQTTISRLEGERAILQRSIEEKQAELAVLTA